MIDYNHLLPFLSFHFMYNSGYVAQASKQTDSTSSRSTVQGVQQSAKANASWLAGPCSSQFPNGSYLRACLSVCLVRNKFIEYFASAAALQWPLNVILQLVLFTGPMSVAPVAMHRPVGPW